MFSDINISFHFDFIWAMLIFAYLLHAYYALSLDHDFEKTSDIDYLKIMILHSRIFLFFSQFLFSILTRFQSAQDENIFFFFFLDKSFKKRLLIFRHSFRCSFKVGLSLFKKNVICLIESPLKMMKNAFYLILKALFVLKIFTFFS